MKSAVTNQANQLTGKPQRKYADMVRIASIGTSGLLVLLGFIGLFVGLRRWIGVFGILIGFFVAFVELLCPPALLKNFDVSSISSFLNFFQTFVNRGTVYIMYVPRNTELLAEFFSVDMFIYIYIYILFGYFIAGWL